MSLPALSSLAIANDFIGRVTSAGVIALHGEDRVKYLQSQVTCDVSALAINNSCLGALCDHKGKMWSQFHLINQGDRLLLILQQSALPAMLRELKKYGVFSKVEIEDVSNTMHVFVSTVPLDSALNTSVTIGDVIFYISLSESALTEVNGDAQYSALHTLAGIGLVEVPTQAEFVPQMMNLQAINAIDFTKGCYMGQETVARTKYLGRNKRAGFILTSASEVVAEAGDTLEMALGDNWRRAGTVINHAVLNGKTWIFAVLPNDLSGDSMLRLKTNPDTAFEVQPLPYLISDS